MRLLPANNNCCKLLNFQIPSLLIFATSPLIVDAKSQSQDRQRSPSISTSVHLPTYLPTYLHRCCYISISSSLLLLMAHTSTKTVTIAIAANTPPPPPSSYSLETRKEFVIRDTPRRIRNYMFQICSFWVILCHE